MQEESDEKLKQFDTVVSGKPVEPAEFFGGPPGGGPRGGPPGDGPRGGDVVIIGPGGDRRGPDGPRFGGPPGFGQPVKPIKGFVDARSKSVIDQLSGADEGKSLVDGGFGPPGGPGGPGGPGPGNRGPGGFEPGNFLAPALLSSFDANNNGELSRDEFVSGFDKWFDACDTDHAGILDEAHLRDGLNRQFVARFPGPPQRIPDNN